MKAEVKFLTTIFTAGNNINHVAGQKKPLPLIEYYPIKVGRKQRVGATVGYLRCSKVRSLLFYERGGSGDLVIFVVPLCPC